jgi:SAM-dependent methyltransferase
MHPAAFDFVATAIKEAGIVTTGAKVLELGSYIVNGTVRHHFVGADEYVGVDIRPGDGVDIVADATAYCPREELGYYDVIVTTEMLEHCREPKKVIANAYKLLRPGGFLILTAAGRDRPAHGNDGAGVGEEYYGNIDENDLVEWLSIFTNHHVEYHGHPYFDVYACGKK